MRRYKRESRRILAGAVGLRSWSRYRRQSRRLTEPCNSRRLRRIEASAPPASPADTLLPALLQHIQRQRLNTGKCPAEDNGPYAILEDTQQDDKYIDKKDRRRHIDGGIFFVQNEGDGVETDRRSPLADTEVIACPDHERRDESGQEPVGNEADAQGMKGSKKYHITYPADDGALKIILPEKEIAQGQEQKRDDICDERCV